MTPKQEAALRQAREALQYVYEGANNQGPHTGISWRCASNKVEPVIAAIDEALADNALDKMADNAKELGLDYEPIVEQVEDSVGMGHGAWDMVEPKKLAKAFHEALAEQPAQQDYWQEEARRYAQNAEFWRGKYEAATAQQQEPVVWMYINRITHETSFQKQMRSFVDHSQWKEVPLYSEPLANHEFQCVCGAVWCGDEMVHLPDKRPQPSKPLTDEQIIEMYNEPRSDAEMLEFARAIEAAHGIKGDA